MQGGFLDNHGLASGRMAMAKHETLKGRWMGFWDQGPLGTWQWTCGQGRASWSIWGSEATGAQEGGLTGSLCFFGVSSGENTMDGVEPSQS